MNSFLTEFLAYFFPVDNLPECIQVFVGCFLLALLIKLIIVVLDR